MNSHPAYSIEGADRSSSIIVTCDHATNIVPPCVGGGSLGIAQEDMNRHIAFDIGAEGVARRLGERLDAAVISTRFSRLVIDPNRGEDDPTLIMQLYDGAIIHGNRGLDHVERERRLEAFHRPYDQALAKLAASRKGPPIFISVHSFTPQLRGRAPRPWEVGILFAHDQRLSDPLIASLETGEPDLTIGRNQPYNGALKGDAMDRHALTHGHLHALIELRNDLIETQTGQHHWADRLVPHLTHSISTVQRNS